MPGGQVAGRPRAKLAAGEPPSIVSCGPLPGAAPLAAPAAPDHPPEVPSLRAPRVVIELGRALCRRRTYDPSSNQYLLFGMLWGTAFPVLLVSNHWLVVHRMDTAGLWADLGHLLPPPLLLALPLILSVVLGAVGTIRHEKDQASRREIGSLQEQVAEKTRDLRDSNLQTVLALAQAIEAKDPYTSGHSWRVWEYARRAAVRLGMQGEALEELQVACYLHDVGKIKIPGRILNKPGPLTAVERRIIQLHPIYGERILAPVRAFERVALLIRHHHERSDGTGYPDRLPGSRLPLPVKIMIVADAMDAMCSHRPYRRGLDPAAAGEELRRCSMLPFDPALVPGGRTEACLQFDPEVVQALLRGLAEEPELPELEARQQEEDRLILEYLAGPNAGGLHVVKPG